MSDDGYRALDDAQLCEALRQTDLAELLKTSDEWKLLQEAARRIVDRAVDQFALTDVTNTEKIMELKIIIRKYKYALFAEVDQLAQEGELLFEEAKDRELIKRELASENA